MSTKHRYLRPAAAAQLLDPSTGNAIPIVVAGASYSCAIGSTVDVPYGMGGMQNVNFWIDLGEVGFIEDRPSLSARDYGRTFIDKSLSNKVLTWDGAAWRDTTGAAV
ncbi:MAG TPA: hypothetical protein VGM81_13280 [Burkholderiaceae bacterium]|jgi:hypothetical protein